MHSSREAAVGWFAVGIGVFVAAALAPWTQYFAGNFFYYWLPQLAVLMAMWFLKARPAALAGASLILAAYLYIFDWWFFANGRGDAMAWIGYLSSLPGALIGAVAATLWMRGRHSWGGAAVGAAVFVAILFGIAVNQAVVCNTVMYCGRQLS